MNLIIRLYGFKMTKELTTILEKYKAKLKKRLSNFDSDASKLTIVIKKHDKHTFYSGHVLLSLPVKSLIARCGTHSSEQLVREAFETLFLEYEKYKGKYFSGSSKYPNHQSIRKDISL